MSLEHNARNSEPKHTNKGANYRRKSVHGAQEAKHDGSILNFGALFIGYQCERSWHLVEETSPEL
jgi:hypothetical protein